MKIPYILAFGLFIGLNFLDGHGKTIQQVEICDNAIDDDEDGLIDLNDDDCECSREEPSSLIPNPSFEDQNCCPAGRSQMSCAADWIQASEATTDYIHTCGWMGWDNIPAPMPFPDGEGIVGFRDGRNIQGVAEPGWKEYAGACLLAPLKKGIEYTFEFNLGFVNSSLSPPIEITFFGTQDCENLPFGQGNSSFGCPTNGTGWVRLGSKKVSGYGWQKTSITVFPDRDITAIAIGPSCSPIYSEYNLYYYFDNLVLAESILFPKQVNEMGNACTDEFELSVQHEEGATYQWYKDGIALKGESSNSLKPMLQDGDYAVMQNLDGQCNLSKINQYYVREEVSSVTNVICDNETMYFGDVHLNESGLYKDTIKTKDGCDSILLLYLTVLGKSYDSLYAKIFPEEKFYIENFEFSKKGIYEVTLQSVEGCDSLVHLDLDYYKVFIPNSFSPNDDGVNDAFQIFIEEPNIFINSISIYNRWGNRVYNSNWQLEETSAFWDGGVGEVGKSAGIYTYVVDFRIGDGKSKIIVGDISLIL